MISEKNMQLAGWIWKSFWKASLLLNPYYMFAEYAHGITVQRFCHKYITAHCISLESLLLFELKIYVNTENA